MDKNCFKNFVGFLESFIRYKNCEFDICCDGMGRASASKPWQCFTLELQYEAIKEKYFIECDQERTSYWKYWAFDPSYRMISDYKGTLEPLMSSVGEDKEGLKFFAPFPLYESHGKNYEELLKKHPELAKQCRLERQWPVFRMISKSNSAIFQQIDTITWDAWNNSRFNPNNLTTNNFSSVLFQPTDEDYAMYTPCDPKKEDK
jgi:hypothetical protein